MCGPPLYIGMSLASFNEFGNLPDAMLILTVFDNDGHTVSADYLSILLVIPASPVALIRS